MAVKKLFDGYVVEWAYRDDWESGSYPSAVLDDLEAAKAWGKAKVDDSETYSYVSPTTVPVFVTVEGDRCESE